MEKTIENMDRNRLGILIRCLVILLITGVTNSAAVFVSPLAAHFKRILPQEHRAFRFSRRSRAYIQTEYQQVLYGSSWSNFKRKPFMHRAV